MQTNPQPELVTNYVQYTGQHIFLTGKAGTGKTTFLLEILPLGKGRKLKDGTETAVLSIGPTGNTVAEAIEKAKAAGVDAAHYDMIYLKPVDTELLHEVGKKFRRIVTVEDGTVQGGPGTAVMEFMTENGYHPIVKRIGVPDRFIEHGTVPELYRLCGMDVESIAKTLRDD